MSDELKYFLITHNSSTNATEIAEFGTDAIAANAAYSEKEKAQAPGVETVLLTGDSVQTLRKTHPNLFGKEPLDKHLRFSA